MTTLRKLWDVTHFRHPGQNSNSWLASRHPEFFVDRTPSEYNLMLLPVVVKSSLSNAIRRGGEGKAACDSIWGGRLESLWWPTISIKDYLTNHIWRILIVMCRITLLSLPLIPLDHWQDPPSTVNVACMYLQVNRITIAMQHFFFGGTGPIG